MGFNQEGALGDGTTNNLDHPEEIVSSNVVAISTGGFHTFFKKSDDTVWAMGYDFFGQLGDGFNSALSGFSNSVYPVPEQVIPSPQPALNLDVSANTDLQFSATCLFGGTFHLLASPDPGQPAGQWTPVATTLVTNRGPSNYAATLTNAVTPAAKAQFYLLQSY